MIRKILTALAATAVALGVPAALVLGTPAPAQACFFIGGTVERPACTIRLMVPLQFGHGAPSRS